jgi:hypothetical protein
VPDRQVFSFSYGAFRPLLSALGMGPAFSRIELRAERLLVRMGWAFSADVPRSAIGAVTPSDGPVGGIGVHGWRGSWLVNGSMRGLVSISLKPPQRARVMGVPVRLRTLILSVDERDALIAALGVGA